MPAGSVRRMSSTICMAVPELTPGAARPSIS
jgi:hypothetical protein